MSLPADLIRPRDTSLGWARLLSALILLAVIAHLHRPSMCGSSTWLPYEDESGFGYGDWFCQRPMGHSGDHAGWWNP
jgi:hypothetical protein